ncbi:MBL fold metallo-hydrolase [Fusobacterium varium]|uniref:MBL fold metallo-hydrolase n=1 Tax=Fusobacterium varium TaxID=856 RepID=UPI000E3FAAFA|nr:MBL fold metallo-hydrolase [Fusobacterium varium]MCI6031923.1 MBL fold metallo-hydrolase [Fusobacterium varium]MDY4004562.1 MBL fold metallo-hydrolase [Fusobacterium varium]RGJ25331.1 MBL fold metallo-hydrolase [Fusobacterium varium]
MKITTLIENEAGHNKELKNEFGLSLFIEDEDISLIFDTGKSGDFIFNAQKLQIPLNNTKHVVLSHSHFDHTGGIRKLVDTFNNKFTLHISKTFFEEKHRITGVIHEFLGNNFNEKYILDKGININYIDTDEFKLSKNITLFTNFKSLNNFETPTRYYFRKIYDDYILDSMEDELVLGIDTSKGLLIVCGCSHIGIANIVENIKCRTQKKIYGIIGGLHLSKASDERIEKVLKYFDECNIEFFGVSHCTGEKVTKILRESKKNFIYNNTGNTIIIA